jgi:hypothetical protein
MTNSVTNSSEFNQKTEWYADDGWNKAFFFPTNASRTFGEFSSDSGSSLSYPPPCDEEYTEKADSDTLASYTCQ